MSSQHKRATALCLLGGLALIAQMPVQANERDGRLLRNQDIVEPERALRAPREYPVERERTVRSAPEPRQETERTTSTEPPPTTERSQSPKRRPTGETAPSAERRSETERTVRGERRPAAEREPAFDSHEQERIRRWYHERDIQPGVGAEKGRKDLPPGLQRRLQRGGELPPGWQRKVEPGMTMSQEQIRHARRPSPELIEQLPEQPEGTVLVESDDQVVRVNETTGMVLDVLDIMRRR